MYEAVFRVTKRSRPRQGRLDLQVRKHLLHLVLQASGFLSNQGVPFPGGDKIYIAAANHDSTVMGGA